jgi:diguanylate cyclase (GGDEF)-like protein
LSSGSLAYEAGRIAFGLVGLTAAVRAARDPALAARARLAWRATAASFAILVATPPLLLMLDGRGFPAGDDVTHAAFVVALLIALQLFPLAATSRRERWKAAVGIVHGLMLSAAVLEGSFYPWGGLALGGAALSGLVLFRQVLVQRESDERAVTDGLTGLANQARFRDASRRALARGARTGRHSAVLIIDMNEFKEVNDTLGHQSGDLVLVAFAGLLRRCVPGGALPARLGGDEFAVVLPDLAGPDEAYDIAGLIAAATGPVVVEGRLVGLACSIGVAVSAPGRFTHDEIVHRADQAMCRAKRMGPDTRWAAWPEPGEPPAGLAAAA